MEDMMREKMDAVLEAKLAGLKEALQELKISFEEDEKALIIKK